MDNVKVNIINHSDNALPEYATQGAAGVDLRAFLPSRIILKPMERQMIPTGLFIELPPGYEAQVRPRSGMAFKQGITCLNSPGTIDSDYRGELKVILINLSDENQIINSGDRIAQMVIGRYEKVQLNLVEALTDTARGHGGFGHSGIK